MEPRLLVPMTGFKAHPRSSNDAAFSCFSTRSIALLPLFCIASFYRVGPPLSRYVTFYVAIVCLSDPVVAKDEKLVQEVLSELLCIALRPKWQSGLDVAFCAILCCRNRTSAQSGHMFKLLHANCGDAIPRQRRLRNGRMGAGACGGDSC